MEFEDLKPEPVDNNAKIVSITNGYLEEARQARTDRMRMNQDNFNIYHHKQDFSHKNDGQSTEFLPKQSMAVEQLAAFIHEGLVDLSDWFTVEKSPYAKETVLNEDDVKKIMQYHLEKVDILNFVADSIKVGALGSLMIAKVGTKDKEVPIYYTETKLEGDNIKKVLKKKMKVVQELNLELCRQQDFFLDPTGSNLFKAYDVYVDYHEVLKLAEGKNAIYDLEVAKRLTSYGDETVANDHTKYPRTTETGQNTTYNMRKRVKLTECWGTIVSETGEILHENVVWTIANDHELLQKPTKTPYWHGEDPFVIAPIIRVPWSVWHRALMDSPTRMNMAINEIFNLIVDSGMMAVHGIKQVRSDWLEDEREIANGIGPGKTLRANSNCPPGAKVLESVVTGSMSPESLNVLNLLVAEHNSGALTNDLRMGVMPQRAVKATEVVEASQTITSMFTSIAKSLEEVYMKKLLKKIWLTFLQNVSDMEPEELIYLLGEQKANQFINLSPEDRFAQYARGCIFKVFGVSETLNKQKDFRKLTALLQTISGSEVLTEAFLKEYSFDKLLKEIVKSLGIQTDHIMHDQEEQAMIQAAQQQQMMQGMQMGGPDLQSQIPQAGADINADSQDLVQSNIPRSHFPPSPATKGMQ